MVLTSSRDFSDWGRVFAAGVVAAAIVDRLLHNPRVLNVLGTYYARVFRSRRNPTTAGDGPYLAPQSLLQRPAPAGLSR